MLRTTIFALVAGVVVAAPQPSWSYSFKDYVASQGGCGAHRNILDMQLERIATDASRAAYINKPLAFELFGQPAADWTDTDIKEAAAVWLDCERRISARAYSGPLSSPQAPLIRQQIDADIESRWRPIEGKLRQVIANSREADDRQAAQEQAVQRQQKDAEARALRLQQAQEITSRRDSERRVDEAREKAKKDRAEAADMRRQVELERQRLEQVEQIAGDAERERREAEDALAKIRTARQAQEQRAQAEQVRRAQSAEVLSIESKPVASRDECAISIGTFNQIRSGMPLAEVESVVGCRGTLNSSSTIPGLGLTELYSWTSRDSGGVITMQFVRRKLQTKSQIGLN